MVADAPGIGQGILDHDGIGSDEGVGSDAAELVNPDIRTKDGMVVNFDVSGQRGSVGHDDVVAHDAVVRHMALRHEQVVVANARHAAASAGPPVQCGKLADDVAFADDEFCPLAGVFQVLWVLTD
jgi:hypothetical protein